ncbi:MAG TPA: hypothetical protein VGJ33_12905 [Candidatus Angelobacter sp.]|jgi:hypothetical protein
MSAARTAAKWTRCYQQEGLAGLYDPRVRIALPGFSIAQFTGLSRATISRIVLMQYASGETKLSDFPQCARLVLVRPFDTKG